ncbi:isoprenylcysteine carboxylmethyltransferase family protein [Acuticoccus sp. MNP-M23]|uniref:methyltransferase family protein n=1 Tax=Acuticoccus sp. MNP-M23 TaxID=3072793 RepID=UPI002815647E|nr:isoprenylcysteine carboxylmethyltransferase family protein [Acuticoccus sp. MNP-M23]WMS44288.1 isoprenylcysteine carboxylmethyltransferase family protein [Acuticoccus sp. MNP-M23]
MATMRIWPPVWTALFIALAFAAAQFWQFGNAETIFVGWLLISLSVVISLWSVYVLRKSMTTVLPDREPAALVTRGPFALSRNPIYAADCLAVVGFAFAFRQPFAALLAIPLGMILQRAFIRTEEERLYKAFGRVYQAYASNVRRWL